MRDLSADEAKAMMRKKQELEIRLAWDLLEIFNEDKMGLIKPLRVMVKRSIKLMDEIANEDRYAATFKKEWMTDWSKWYFKFAETKQSKIPKITEKEWDPDVAIEVSETFIAQQCADWIRVFGEVMEKVIKDNNDKEGIRQEFKGLNEKRTGFQKGGKYHWTKFDIDKQKKKGDSVQKEAGRRRVKGKDVGRHGVLGDYALPDDESVWGFQRDITGAAGLGKWRVMEKDTTGKMDQVFGLMPGATISGTTTDNIFFFRQFGGYGMNHIFYVLPTATIVTGGHHSLLEVGIPLMLNKINDYRVGLYSTLFPARATDKAAGKQGVPSGVAAIKSTLQYAETHPDNHLMLIFYKNKGSAPAGGLLYETPQDKRTWAKMKIGEEFLKAFNAMGPWPSKKQVNYVRGLLSI